MNKIKFLIPFNQKSTLKKLYNSIYFSERGDAILGCKCCLTKQKYD